MNSIKQLALIALGLMALNCSSNPKPQQPNRPPAISQPRVVVTANPNIIVWPYGYVKFTARLVNVDYLECYSFAWAYGDGVDKAWATSEPELFKSSQVIHLYSTGIFNPKFVVQCTSGIYYGELVHPIRVGQRSNN